MFKKNVKQFIDELSKRVNDNPPKNADDQHAIKFSPLDDQTFAEIRNEMKEFAKKTNHSAANSSSSPTSIANTPTQSNPSGIIKHSKF